MMDWLLCWCESTSLKGFHWLCDSLSELSVRQSVSLLSEAIVLKELEGKCLCAIPCSDISLLCFFLENPSTFLLLTFNPGLRRYHRLPGNPYEQEGNVIF